MHQNTQNHVFKFSIRVSVSMSRQNYRQIYGKSKASLCRNLRSGTPPNFLGQSFALQLQFTTDIFSEQPFYGNYSTLYSRTLTRFPTRQDGVENRDKVYYYNTSGRSAWLKLLFLGHLSLMKNKAQTAVINTVSFRIFINLTFRMLSNINFQK